MPPDAVTTREHSNLAESVSRKTAIGATWLIAWRLFTRVLGVGTTLIMARILLPADFGLLAMATAFAAAIDACSQFGLQEALIRRTADDDELHDTAFTFQLLRAVLTGAVIATSAPSAAIWFSEPRLAPILWVIAAGSVISGFRNIGIVAFRRDMNYDKQFRLLCVPRLVQVAITIPLAFLLHSYWALVGGIIVAKLGELVMSYVIHPYRPRLTLRHWRELVGFSAWTWAASLASIVWDRGDPFIIGPAVGSMQLGIFLLAAEIAVLPVSELVSPAADALFAGFSMAQKQGSSPVSTALPVATSLLLVIMPIMLAISCTAGYIVAVVLGPAWVAAQPLVVIAAWLGLFSPFSYVCSAALVSANHVRANFLANAAASVIKLVCLTTAILYTTDLRTIMMVSVGTVAVESSTFIMFLCRAGDARPGEALGAVLRMALAAAITLAAVSATGLSVTPIVMPGWQALLVGGALGCGTMAIFVAADYALWRIAGQPEGAETRAARLFWQIVGPRLERLVRITGVRLKGYV